MGPAPCCSSRALARLNGREPKKPRSAEFGLGCADSISGTPSSSGARLRASRPHKIATSGVCRAASARMACSVTSSQPWPRWEPGLRGSHGEHPVEQQHAALAPRGQIAVGRGRVAEVGGVLPEDVEQAGRQPAYLGRDREAQPDRITGRGVGILADDQHPHLVERLLEGAQYPVARGQVAAARGHLRAQEVAHRGDPARDRGQRAGPARLDDLTQFTACHGITVGPGRGAGGTGRSSLEQIFDTAYAGRMDAALQESLLDLADEPAPARWAPPCAASRWPAAPGWTSGRGGWPAPRCCSAACGRPCPGVRNAADVRAGRGRAAAAVFLRRGPAAARPGAGAGPPRARRALRPGPG